MTQIKSFRNPIIPGFHPDPSCILVDDTYYLVTSSFLYTPGIPVYTSKDLVHWTQIGNVITRPSQLSLAKCTIRPGTKNCGGVWAPTIRYHQGTFYVCATCVFPDREFGDHSRWQNIIWNTTDPRAYDAWSDGVEFYFPGYDTSLFWDNDQPTGTVYIQGSTYWRVQEGISQVLLDLETGRSLSGEPKEIWLGTGRRIPEAPHMYRKDGWYYLLIAEGGTELEHCATIARSKSVWGPFEPNPQNPIVHAATKDAYFQTIGHADVFQTPSGDWFAVALATRDGRVNFPMGRETVLIPGTWPTDGWPVFDTPVESIMGPEPVEGLPKPKIEENVLAGFTWREGKTVCWPHGLLRLRNPDGRSYAVEDGVLYLAASSSGDGLSGAFGSPTFIARRQTAIECTTELEMVFGKDTVGGVSVYLDFEDHLDLVFEDGVARMRGVASDSDVRVMVDRGALVYIRVIARYDRFSFFVRQKGGEDGWTLVGEGAASTVSGGFTGVVIGPFIESGSSRVEVRKWTYVE